jgi:hypothetical protein
MSLLTSWHRPPSNFFDSDHDDDYDNDYQGSTNFIRLQKMQRFLHISD